LEFGQFGDRDCRSGIRIALHVSDVRSQPDRSIRAALASTHLLVCCGVIAPLNRPRGIGCQIAAPLIVRLILGITLMLLGLGMLLSQVEGTANSSPVSSASARQWVRTANGWEKSTAWSGVTTPAPRLHPLVVAAGQGLVSVLGLAVFRRERR
jgi:hypothetical protein